LGAFIWALWPELPVVITEAGTEAFFATVKMPFGTAGAEALFFTVAVP
jgi:hypothetical protein